MWCQALALTVSKSPSGRSRAPICLRSFRSLRSQAMSRPITIVPSAGQPFCVAWSAAEASARRRRCTCSPSNTNAGNALSGRPESPLRSISAGRSPKLQLLRFSRSYCAVAVCHAGMASRPLPRDTSLLVVSKDARSSSKSRPSARTSPFVFSI